VNLGLVYGQKKDGVRGKDYYQIGNLSWDLKRTCPKEYYQKAAQQQLKNAQITRYEVIMEDVPKKHDDFDRDSSVIKQRQKKIDGLLCVREVLSKNIKNSKVPWFLPQWLGGLGILPFKEGQVTHFDIICSLKIREDVGAFDTKLKPRKFGDISIWQMHKLVNKNLEDFSFLDNQNFEKVNFRVLDREDLESIELLESKRNLSEEFMTLYNLKLCEHVLQSRLHRKYRDSMYGVKETVELDGVERRLDEVNDIYRSSFLYDPESASEGENLKFNMKIVEHNRRIWWKVRRTMQKESKFDDYFQRYVKTGFKDFDIGEFDPEKKDFPMSCFNITA